MYIIPSCFKIAQQHGLAIKLKPMCFFSGHHVVAAYSRKFKDNVSYFIEARILGWEA